MRAAAALSLAVLASTPAEAGAAEEPDVCYGVMPLDSPEFSEPALRLVAPDAPKRVRFVKTGYERTGCPGPDESCASAAYVTPGDPVVVAGATGAYLCGSFVGRRPAGAFTSGWLPAAALADPASPPAPKLAEWSGVWRAGAEKRISIGGDRKRLRIEGEATWGASDPQRVESGAVHTGAFEATVTPVGGTAGFATGPDGETLAFEAETQLCKVRFWRLGPYLVAADNNRCGGANVTFTDVYRRD